MIGREATCRKSLQVGNAAAMSEVSDGRIEINETIERINEKLKVIIETLERCIAKCDMILDELKQESEVKE